MKITRKTLLALLALLALLTIAADNGYKYIHHNVLLTGICIEARVPVFAPLPLLWEDGKCEALPEEKSDNPEYTAPEDNSPKHKAQCEASKTHPEKCNPEPVKFIPYSENGDNTLHGPYYPNQDNYIL